jgi:hypothetical protein
MPALQGSDLGDAASRCQQDRQEGEIALALHGGGINRLQACFDLFLLQGAA